MKGRIAMGVPTVVPGSADTFIDTDITDPLARGWTLRPPIPARLDDPEACPAHTDDDACTDADVRRIALSAR